MARCGLSRTGTEANVLIEQIDVYGLRTVYAVWEFSCGDPGIEADLRACSLEDRPISQQSVN